MIETRTTYITFNSITLFTLWLLSVSLYFGVAKPLEEPKEIKERVEK